MKAKNWRSNHKSRTSSFSADELAWELHELLDIPKTICKSKGVGHSYQMPKKGREIIAAIVKTLVAALQREESVEIKGFGKFVVETRKVRSGGTILASDANGENLVISKVHVPHSPKKRVIFYPSDHLMAMVNQEPPCVPNADQRDAMKTWRPNDGNSEL